MNNSEILERNIDKRELVKNTFPVAGMSCTGCAASVESILKQTEGVKEANVNFASHSVLVEYEESTSANQLQSALQNIGFDLILDVEDPSEAQHQHQQKAYKEAKTRTLWAFIFALPVVVIGMFFMEWELGKWLSMVLSIPVLFWFGRHFYSNAWKLAKNKSANMDTLVALSTGIAFIFSAFNTVYPSYWLSLGLEAHVYFEAAVVIIAFISFGKLLEEKAKTNTSTALKKLMSLQAKSVVAVFEGNEVEIPIASVKEGFEIVVKPGEKVPVDGIVTEGNSFVDESMITGEPLAVKKENGEKVFAGTLNQKGSFHFKAEKVGNETLLSQIIKTVQEAQGSKAPVQKLVDKIAAIFVPTVIMLSILTFAIWMIFGGENAFTFALLNAITVLVISCPCALGLATPTAIMVGVGKGAENNILIKDAEALDIGRKIDTIVLDKTGTITQGKPTVSDLFWKEDKESDALKSILFAIEKRSEHPLATAVTEYFKNDKLENIQLTDFKTLVGRGVNAKNELNEYYIGNFQLIKEKNISISEPLKNKAKNLQSQAKTVVYFTDSNEVLAILAINDSIKESSKEAISTLKKANVEVHMLTGDNTSTANEVANTVGIEFVKSEVLPNEKLQYIQALQEKGKTVAMVGDGINDAEALAKADLSIAMGKGSDIAIDVAKLTLITSDLKAIPKALKLSKKTVNGIQQNLFWAFIYNLIGIPIAAGLLYPFTGFLLNPMIAGAAMAFSSVSVVLNSLRLKSSKL